MDLEEDDYVVCLVLTAKPWPIKDKFDFERQHKTLAKYPYKFIVQIQQNV